MVTRLPGSQCDRILAVLADGRPHQMEEIHQRVGFCRLNSRIAELRGRGHNIVCDKTDHRYVYQLVAPLKAQPAPQALLGSGAGSGCALSGADRDVPDPPSVRVAEGNGAAQLSLLESAA